MLNHKEMTTHIRNRIKLAGVKALVSMVTTCGQPKIRVSVPSYDVEFTAEEIMEISKIAMVNGLTGARKSEIDPKHDSKLTGRKEWFFEFHHGRKWPSRK